MYIILLIKWIHIHYHSFLLHLLLLLFQNNHHNRQCALINLEYPSQFCIFSYTIQNSLPPFYSSMPYSSKSLKERNLISLVVTQFQNILRASSSPPYLNLHKVCPLTFRILLPFKRINHSFNCMYLKNPTYLGAFDYLSIRLLRPPSDVFGLDSLIFYTYWRRSKGTSFKSSSFRCSYITSN